MIQLPGNFVASTTETMAGNLVGLSPYIILIVGTILALVVVEILINALRPK